METCGTVDRGMVVFHCRLVGDVLMKSDFLTYCGPFNYDVRQQLMDNWVSDLNTWSIPHIDNLDIITMLSDPLTVSVFMDCCNFELIWPAVFDFDVQICFN